MILTCEEISFLDVYCHEGTELPFGGPATDVMTRIGVQSGDTLNIQWAYLRDQPPTGPIIGHASRVVPPLPWPNRDAVLRRDAEIRAIREEMQRARSMAPPLQESRGDDSRAHLYVSGRRVIEAPGMPRPAESMTNPTQSFLAIEGVEES